MKQQNARRAFSLIELSIVLLIIGIIIAGITQSSRLIRQFKLSTARNQTQGAPVNSISGLVLWYDTVMPGSFKDSEAEDGNVTTAYINTWYDLNTTSSARNNAIGNDDTTSPQRYENCMNGLPCLRFVAADGTFMTLTSLPALANSDYTIFVVEQRRSSDSNNFFIGGSVSATAEARLTLGYNSNTTIRFDQGAASNTNYYTAAVNGYVTASPNLHTFVSGYGWDPDFGTSGGINYVTGLKSYYRNGTSTQANSDSGLTAVGTPTDTTLSTSWTSMLIGKTVISGSTSFFDGDIGEIIIFNRALKNEERTSIETYLLKKWGILKAA